MNTLAEYSVGFFARSLVFVWHNQTKSYKWIDRRDGWIAYLPTHRYGELYLHKSKSMKTKAGKWFDDEMKSADK